MMKINIVKYFNVLYILHRLDTFNLLSSMVTISHIKIVVQCSVKKL